MIIVSQDETIIVNSDNVKGFWIESAYLDENTDVFRLYTDLNIIQDGRHKPACLAEYITEGDAIKALSEMVNAIVSSGITKQKAFYFKD